jgi:hypothetical protein
LGGFFFKRLQKDASGLNFEGRSHVNYRALVKQDLLICEALSLGRFAAIEVFTAPREIEKYFRCS